MIKRFNKMREQEGGFTLIELLIVIIVLGILVAIVLFSLGTFKSDSQQAACKADVKQLTTAETAYFAKSGNGATAAQLVTLNYLQSQPTLATDGKTLAVQMSGNNVQVSVDNGANWLTPTAASAAC